MRKKRNKDLGPTLNETTRLEDHSINTILGKGIVFIGDIQGDGVVRFDGEVNGNIHLKKGIVLGESGKVNGNIHSDNLIIYGKINGNVLAKEVLIKQGGQIAGDIETEIIEIEKGGAYNGQLKMTSANPGNAQNPTSSLSKSVESTSPASSSTASSSSKTEATELKK